MKKLIQLTLINLLLIGPILFITAQDDSDFTPDSSFADCHCAQYNALWDPNWNDANPNLKCECRDFLNNPDNNTSPCIATHSEILSNGDTVYSFYPDMQLSQKQSNLLERQFTGMNSPEQELEVVMYFIENTKDWELRDLDNLHNLQNLYGIRLELKPTEEEIKALSQTVFDKILEIALSGDICNNPSNEGYVNLLLPISDYIGFNTVIMNLGKGPFELTISEEFHDGHTHELVEQNIYTLTRSQQNNSWTFDKEPNELDIDFALDDEHDHFHLSDVWKATLYKCNNGNCDEIVNDSNKDGWCIGSSGCVFELGEFIPNSLYESSIPPFSNFKFPMFSDNEAGAEVCDDGLGTLGITSGWVDIYSFDYDGQFLDMSGMCPGDYKFKTVLFPGTLDGTGTQYLTESDEGKEIELSFTREDIEPGPIVLRNGINVEWSCMNSQGFSSDIVIEQGATLNIKDSELAFADDKGITVKKGGVLILDGTTLKSSDRSSGCNNGAWRGIKLEGDPQDSNGIPILDNFVANQGRLFASNHSIIENALIGVDIGGYAFIDNTSFINCKTGVKISMKAKSWSRINNSTFETKNVGTAPSILLHQVKGIHLDMANVIAPFSNNTFNSGLGYYSNNIGISALGSTFTVNDGSTFTNHKIGVLISEFNNAGFAIIDQNTFQNCFIGIDFREPLSIQITGNEIYCDDKDGSMGICGTSPSTSIISGNNIYSPSNITAIQSSEVFGIVTESFSGTSNNVHSNFENVFHGNFSAANQFKHSNSGVTVDCNTYKKQNLADWHIAGSLNPQGDCDPANNKNGTFENWHLNPSNNFLHILGDITITPNVNAVPSSVPDLITCEQPHSCGIANVPAGGGGGNPIDAFGELIQMDEESDNYKYELVRTIKELSALHEFESIVTGLQMVNTKSADTYLIPTLSTLMRPNEAQVVLDKYPIESAKDQEFVAMQQIVVDHVKGETLEGKNDMRFEMLQEIIDQGQSDNLYLAENADYLLRDVLTLHPPVSLKKIDQTILENPSQLVFSPNPTRDIIYIYSNEANMDLNAKVYDLAGKLRLSAFVENGKLDCSSLTPGTYLVKLEGYNEGYKIVIY